MLGRTARLKGKKWRMTWTASLLALLGSLMRLLHVQVHEVVKQVKEYPPAAEEAVHNIKLAAQRARLAEKVAARQSPQQRKSKAGWHSCVSVHF